MSSSAAGNNAWPPALREFVNQSFVKVTPQNKDAVDSELKKIIFDAFQSGVMWTMDWSTVQLESLKTPGTKKRKIGQISIKTPLVSVASTSALNAVSSTEPAQPSSSTSFSAIIQSSNLEADRRSTRARRFEREHAIEKQRESGSLMSGVAAMNTNGRSKWPGVDGSAHGGFGVTKEYDPNVIDWDYDTIVGTSTKLEKRYLRLTSAPNPEDIRPLPILKQTLELLKKKWKADSNYPYICDQFKSLRQDLTVQRLKTSFTVSVYEIHARIAVETGDLGEYNQCQAMLQQLYSLNLGGQAYEFMGYRILYLLYSRNWSAVNLLLPTLTMDMKSQPAVRHALGVRSALATNNYHSLFRLYAEAPNMSGYLMDKMVERERVKALVTMSKAYPTLPLKFICGELCFDNYKEAQEFLAKHNAWALAGSSQSIISVEDAAKLSQLVLDMKFVSPILVALLGTFTKVDIKGQHAGSGA